MVMSTMPGTLSPRSTLMLTSSLDAELPLRGISLPRGVMSTGMSASLSTISFGTAEIRTSVMELSNMNRILLAVLPWCSTTALFGRMDRKALNSDAALDSALKNAPLGTVSMAQSLPSDMDRRSCSGDSSPEGIRPTVNS